MTLKAELVGEVNSIVQKVWTTVDASTVPEPADLALDANEAKTLESATVLYADIDGSTSMVEDHIWWFSAEV